MNLYEGKSFVFSLFELIVMPFNYCQLDFRPFSLHFMPSWNTKWNNDDDMTFHLKQDSRRFHVFMYIGVERRQNM